ncbi:hypothetical protein V8C34DRAFT_272832 [Trichoderma compactum]
MGSYWAFAIKLRNDSAKEERAPEADIAPREYWAFAIQLRDGVTAKRAIFVPQCGQAEEGIYCTYTSVDIEAYGRGPKIRRAASLLIRECLVSIPGQLLKMMRHNECIESSNTVIPHG